MRRRFRKVAMAIEGMKRTAPPTKRQRRLTRGIEEAERFRIIHSLRRRFRGHFLSLCWNLEHIWELSPQKNYKIIKIISLHNIINK